MSSLGSLDLDTRFEYMIIYKDKTNNTINTWTLDESAMVLNYELMKQRDNVEILAVYKKLKDEQIQDILHRE